MVGEPIRLPHLCFPSGPQYRDCIVVQRPLLDIIILASRSGMTVLTPHV